MKFKSDYKVCAILMGSLNFSEGNGVTQSCFNINQKLYTNDLSVDCIGLSRNNTSKKNTIQKNNFFSIFKSICKYDIVMIHGMFNFRFTLIMVFCKLLSIKTIVFSHGGLNLAVLNRMSILKKTYVFVFERLYFNLSSFVVLSGDSERNSKLLRNKSYVILPNLPSKIIKKRAKKNSEIITIGLIGRYLFHAKGLDRILSVLRVISKKNKIKLIIAGDGPDLSLFLKNSAKLNNISVENRGLVYHEKKEKFYSDCDIISLFSRNEGSPMIVKEALERSVFCWLSNECNFTQKMLGTSGIVQFDYDVSAIELSWQLLTNYVINFNQDNFVRNIDKIQQYSGIKELVSVIKKINQ